MRLYDAIFIRRSVRKYTAEISDEKREKLLNFIKNVTPLYDNIKYEIIPANKGVNSKVKAPCYILYYSEKKKGYSVNAGFIMQQIDLFAQSIGLGSCWLGLSSADIKSEKGYKYVIMLAVGETEKAYRTSAEDFNRKPLEEVGNLEDISLLSAVRLAPSAVNKQPWYYYQRETGEIDIYLKRNMVYKALLKKFDGIDIGISLCHFFIALSAQNKKFELIEPDNKSYLSLKTS